ncbi:MAG TPA: 50S ribosomal protein L28, partial [Dongiaceae bacterium]|nr:50S ribosomal protein L28 [Dongiaceae bacterium]
MARICELTGKGPIKGSIIWRSGKAKKSGGIGTHITAITKRRFLPNLQRVKAVVDGEVRYVRVTAKALKQGLIVKAPK